MKGWNYRVIKKQIENEIYYTIAEVYYDEENCPVGWVECKQNSLQWEEYENLKGTIGLMTEAFDMPTLIIEGEKLKGLN